MGMFTQRPEEPTEWAGLPSEPVRRNVNDQLGEALPVHAIDLVAGANVASVGIPISIVPEPVIPDGLDGADGD